MIELTSPLDDNQFKKIDLFIVENKSLLLSLTNENVKTIQNFITTVSYFKYSVKKLSTEEELKAWNYLYKKTLALRTGGSINSSSNNLGSSNSQSVSAMSNNVWGILSVIFILVIICIFVVMCSSNKESKIQAEKEALTVLSSQESVKRQLKDASSAQFRNMNGLCGEVNAKNGFGAFTGFKRYVASGEIVVIEGQIDQSEFNSVWHKMCQ